MHALLIHSLSNFGTQLSRLQGAEVHTTHQAWGYPNQWCSWCLSSCWQLGALHSKNWCTCHQEPVVICMITVPSVLQHQYKDSTDMPVDYYCRQYQYLQPDIIGDVANLSFCCRWGTGLVCQFLGLHAIGHPDLVPSAVLKWGWLLLWMQLQWTARLFIAHEVGYYPLLVTSTIAAR